MEPSLLTNDCPRAARGAMSAEDARAAPASFEPGVASLTATTNARSAVTGTGSGKRTVW